MLQIGLILVALLLALVGTRFLVDWAPRLRFIDVPNARSSHVRPTPRGGGVAIVLACVVILLLAPLLGLLSARSIASLVLPGLTIALVGLVDDRFGVPAELRFTIHIGSVIVFLWMIGGMPATGIEWLDTRPLLANCLAALAITWSVNFFNFMDGIDGIAGAQALFVAGSLSVMGALDGVLIVMLAGGSVAASTTGFLIWNWPPARIFMGDAGSGFLGFMLAAISVLAIPAAEGNLAAVLILPALFLADSTVTLIRRALRGEPVHHAHRLHAYQHLARRWNSHACVTLASIAVNLLMIAPLAWISRRTPHLGFWLLGVVLIVLGAVAIRVGAGRPEVRPGTSSEPRHDGSVL